MVAKRTVHYTLRRSFPGMVQGCALCGGPLLHFKNDPWSGESWEGYGYLILYCSSCDNFFAMDERHFFIDIHDWHGLVN